MWTIVSRCLGENINKRIALVFFFFIQGAFALVGSEMINDQSKLSLNDILKKKYIRFITTPSAFDYYIYQGQHKGFQYELAKKFVEHLNKKYLRKDPIKIRFEMVPMPFTKMIKALESGRGEIIAANLTITEKRKKSLNFTKHIQKTKELIVTRKELKENNIWHKKIATRKGTSFFEHVTKWNKANNEHFLAIDYADSDLDIENILELLAYGKFDYAFTDSHIFNLAKDIYPSLVLAKDQPFQNKTKIAWATRKANNELLKELNTFIPKVRKGSFYGNIFHKRYFADLEMISNARSTDQISPYDKMIKKYSRKFDWDWRLCSAVAFQESRFDASINNRWGAIGLFQIKQATANEPYINIINIKGVKNVENNIHAGIKYLTWLKKNIVKDAMGEEKNRITLAAYNAGPGTLKKARDMTKKLGLNPNIWYENLEVGFVYIKKLEPVKYVSEISKRYLSYKLMGY